MLTGDVGCECAYIAMAKNNLQYVRTGQCLSSSHKQNISKSTKGRIHSQKTRYKMSIAKKDKYKGINSLSSKKCVINGKLFYTMSEASLFFNVHRCTIYRWIKNNPLCYNIPKIQLT